MLKFILEILIMLSLGAILYIIARVMPRIDDRELATVTLKTHWIAVYIEKIDRRLKSILEKTLRRSGIVILKLDNWVNKKLGKLKKEIDIERGFSMHEMTDKKEVTEEKSSEEKLPKNQEGI